MYFVGAGRGLDYDSSVTVGEFVATHDFWTPFRHQVVFNNHPLFSFVDHLIYLAGGRSELALTVVPVLCGAVGAGVLAGWVTERSSPVEGFVAGTLLAANPAYAELSRSVRGYSMMTLGVIGATLIVDRLSGRRSFVLSTGYVLCVAGALATHLYAGLALVAHGAVVLARRELLPPWIVRWAAALVLGLAPYTFIASSMLEAARLRPKVFHAEFPEQVTQVALGVEPVAVSALLP
nr:hypothetical protein [Actinomycetota bacterium]